jgi:hypothetical protein
MNPTLKRRPASRVVKSVYLDRSVSEWVEATAAQDQRSFSWWTARLIEREKAEYEKGEGRKRKAA